MATLSQAVQAMVDKLHAAMTGATPLTPEEQLLVAKALSALQDNQTWEQALIAVAEEHLTAALAEMVESKDAVDLAKSALQLASTNSVNAIETARTTLVAQAASLTQIPAMANKVARQTNRWPLLNVPHLTMYGVNSAMKYPTYLNDGECLPFRFVDHMTGRVYAAYMSKCTLDSGTTWGPVFHFGYWTADGTFVTLLRRTNPTLADSYRWAGIANSVPNVLVLPLAKSDDPASVRVCFIVMHSAVNAIIHVNPANDAVTLLNLTANCGLGNTARACPLATTQTTNVAYDKLNKRLVVGNGDFVFWDGAFGINGGSITDTYPLAEIQKTNQYIEFSGKHQSFLTGASRFRRWLFDLQAAAAPLTRQAVGSNVLNAEFRDTLSVNWVPHGSSGSGGQFVASSSFSDQGFSQMQPNDGSQTAGSAISNPPMVMTNQKERTVWSQLVRKADGSVDFEQLWTRPSFLNWAAAGASTAYYHYWLLDSVDVEVYDSTGTQVAAFSLRTPARSKLTGSAAAERCHTFLPVAYDSVNKVAHCVYGLVTCYAGGTSYSTGSIHGTPVLDALYKEVGNV